MTEKIIVAGSGGQGAMLLGKIIAEAAMRENKFVTWLPSYGAEVRGGTAHCMITVSDQEIGSPYVDKADTLIILNEQSFDRFKNRIKNNGTLIANGSLVLKDIDENNNRIKRPFTDIAIKLGNIKVANMVALGAYLGKKDIIKKDTVIQTIEEIAPADKKALVEINKNALLAGIELTEK